MSKPSKKRRSRIIDEQLDRAIAVYGNWQAQILPDYHVTFFCRWQREKCRKDGYETAMWVEPSWEYKKAAIYMVAPITADATDDVFEGMVVHELMHARLSEMDRGKGKHAAMHEEHVCEELTWAFLRTRNNERQATKKRAKRAA